MSTCNLKCIAVIIYVAAACSGYIYAEELEDAYLEKLDTMPDFSQNDPRFKSFPFNVSSYCGPTAASNALMWLDANGFPNMVPGEGEPEHQFDLIGELSRQKYMQVTSEGTSSYRVIKGIDKYIVEKNYSVSFSWRGRYSMGKYGPARKPTVQWLMRSVRGSSNVILKIGRYQYNKDYKKYTRISGHLVTMAGYEKKDDELYLVVHDPADGKGVKPRHRYLKLLPLEEGTFARDGLNPASPVEGYFELVDPSWGRRIPVRILDGAIQFTVIDVLQMR